MRLYVSQTMRLLAVFSLVVFFVGQGTIHRAVTSLAQRGSETPHHTPLAVSSRFYKLDLIMVRGGFNFAAGVVFFAAERLALSAFNLSFNIFPN